MIANLHDCTSQRLTISRIVNLQDCQSPVLPIFRIANLHDSDAAIEAAEIADRNYKQRSSEASSAVGSEVTSVVSEASSAVGSEASGAVRSVQQRMPSATLEGPGTTAPAYPADIRPSESVHATMVPRQAAPCVPSSSACHLHLQQRKRVGHQHFQQKSTQATTFPTPAQSEAQSPSRLCEPAQSRCQHSPQVSTASSSEEEAGCS